MTTQERISTELGKLAQQRNIKILLACETGSRAWGFPSPDSDYDIRLIYSHSRDWYLSLKESKDTLEIMLDGNELDITGWDLRKSLRLLSKSNAALLERIQSPIIYSCDEKFLQEIKTRSANHYSRIAGMYHYLSMAQNCLDEIDRNSTFKLKKFFYGLRTAAACKWIIEKDQTPPIVFMELVSGLGIEKNLIDRFKELITLKATVSESYFHKGESQIFSLIDGWLEEAKQKANDLPAAKGRLTDLNNFFINTISGNAD